ncbi:non-ribosomal peptide synthetase [Micromonospora coerulea]|uniref:non-ribosomal peptide synthetase n=1 Tax=Micromonospora coerulea TaxID=47856 RepID=UPI0019061DDD|nr:non-ribosomal peptide synthetase [Micromonospora veneta]
MFASRSHTAGSFDPALTVPGAFDAVAAAVPDNVALDGVAGRLTYAQLRARSEVLSAALGRRGVGLGTVVGVHLERSFDSLITYLAILKAGGSYLPLSPEYPPSRLKLLLSDAGAVFVVAAELPPWSAEVDSPVVTLARLRSDGGGSGDESAASHPMPVTPEDVAYVMYTSGSTGTPKGVLVTHRNIVQLVRDQDYLDFGAGEAFLHLSPTAFDASTFEIWGALLSGARLVLAPSGRSALADLPVLLRERGVSAMFLTTPLFHELMDSDPGALDPVRQVLVGGEPMSVERALLLARRRSAATGGTAPASVAANVYGPTETTTFATAFRLDQLDGNDKSVPIGRPLSHTSVYLLREDGSPAAEGESGEIYIGGAGVSRGYLGRPAQTAERFLPDPFSGVQGARMYRSGDVGRLRPDGAIEFLGRIDNQVKIRGFRIEPVEVEEALLNHAGVREAAVVAVPVPDGVRLAAYVVPGAGQSAELTPVALATYLRGLVPGFMVPSWFVTLSELPRTVTGKLDRRELPALDEADLPRFSGGPTGGPGDEDGPLSPTEERLVEIWKQILQVETVGIDDDFFSLGGDSIRILRVLAEAEARGLELSLVQLFEHTTIRELAASVQ